MQAQTRHQDTVIVVPDRTWRQFKRLQEAFEDSRAVKFSYFDGTIEILMPSEAHDLFSRIIFLLISQYCLEKQIQFIPVGSADRERDGVVFVQPDESFYVGSRKSAPDLAIEVVFTGGNETKLPKYQALEIPEVWFWEDGVFKLYRLFEGEYKSIQQSEIEGFENLNVQTLSRCVLIGETDMLGAIAELKRSL
jgi:Uma2 family endonuclease